MLSETTASLGPDFCLPHSAHTGFPQYHLLGDSTFHRDTFSCYFIPSESQVFELCFVRYILGLSYHKKTATWISVFFVLQLLVNGLSLIS